MRAMGSVLQEFSSYCIFPVSAAQCVLIWILLGGNEHDHEVVTEMIDMVGVTGVWHGMTDDRYSHHANFPWPLRPCHSSMHHTMHALYYNMPGARSAGVPASHAVIVPIKNHQREDAEPPPHE